MGRDVARSCRTDFTPPAICLDVKGDPGTYRVSLETELEARTKGMNHRIERGA